MPARSSLALGPFRFRPLAHGGPLQAGVLPARRGFGPASLPGLGYRAAAPLAAPSAALRGAVYRQWSQAALKSRAMWRRCTAARQAMRVYYLERVPFSRLLG